MGERLRGNKKEITKQHTDQWHNWSRGDDIRGLFSGRGYMFTRGIDLAGNNIMPFSGAEPPQL